MGQSVSGAWVDRPRIAVLGLGAIGGWLAHALASSGHEVRAVARGATLQALQTGGLVLEQAGPKAGDLLSKTQLPAQVLRPETAKILIEEHAQFDLLVLAVKAPALADAAHEVAALLAPGGVVLAAMNGVPWWFLQGFGGPLAGSTLHSVDAGGAIARLLPAARVVGAVVHASWSTPAPGLVRHHGGNRLILGEAIADAGGQASARVQAIANLLRGCGVGAEASSRIHHELWYKLWGNMTMNPISALTGATIDAILADPLVLGLVTDVMNEAKAIGAQLGIDIAETPQDRHRTTAKLGAFKTSMLQDAQAGRPLELDALVGAVRELAQLCGHATPATDALFGLTRLMARERGLYPRET